MVKGSSLEAQVRGMVRSEVGKLQDQGVVPIPEGAIEDSGFEVEGGIQSPSSEAKKEIANILTSEGCFAKVYKISPSTGKKESKGYDIEFPIEGSLEAELSRIAKEKGWGSGAYVAMGFEHGKRGILFNKRIVVPELTPAEKEIEAANKPTKPTTPDPFDTVDKAFQIADRIKPKEVDVASISNTIVEAIKTGKEMSGGNGVDALLSKILPLILQLIKPSGSELTEDKIVRIIQAEVEKLKPKEDFFQQLIKYQEVSSKIGGKRDDALDSVHKVTEIVQAIRPLAGGGGGGALEPPSWIELAFKYGSDAITSVVSAWKESLDIKKEQLRIGGPSNLIPITDQPNPNQPRLTHPFVTKFMKAVNEDDYSYFDNLRQRIATISPQFIDGLITGEFTPDYILEVSGEVYGIPMDNPKLKPYIEKFVSWLQKEFPDVEEGKGGIIPAS